MIFDFLIVICVRHFIWNGILVESTKKYVKFGCIMPVVYYIE